MSESDAALLGRIPSDRAALERFYRCHVDAIERFAVRRSRDPGEAAELVSAVFLAVIESAAGYDARRGPARAWLFGIAVRLLAEERRTWWRDERTMRRFAGQAVLEPDDYARLEDQIDAARRGPAVVAALDSLSARDRELFLLVAEEELSVADAARVLGITPVAGRMRLRRARLKLRGALETPELVPVSETEGTSS
jgi:RNA polymerase sigma factor (sigma-70 family)